MNRDLNSDTEELEHRSRAYQRRDAYPNDEFRNRRSSYSESLPRRTDHSNDDSRLDFFGDDRRDYEDNRAWFRERDAYNPSDNFAPHERTEDWLDIERLNQQREYEERQYLDEGRQWYQEQGRGAGPYRDSQRDTDDEEWNRRRFEPESYRNDDREPNLLQRHRR